MKRDLYVYYSNADRAANPCPDGCKSMDFSQLVLIAKSKRFFRELWAYRKVCLFVPTVEALPKPFLTAMICRLMTLGRCVYQDTNGTITVIGVGQLIREFVRFVAEHMTYKSAMRAIDAELTQLEHTQKFPVKLRTDNGVPPVFLRSDFSYGYAAGGSIGHIAGVIRHLGDKFGCDPIFLTTDQIPSVHVAPRMLRGPVCYRNLRDIASLFFSDTVYKAASAELKNQPISMLYQRSAANSYAGVRLAMDRRVPFVLEYNGSEVWVAKYWADRKKLRGEALSIRIEQLTFEKADLIVCVSEPLRAELKERGIPTEKILVNPNGVNPQLYHPGVDGGAVRRRYGLAADDVVIGFIGTFGAWHGTEILAKAFVRLVREHGAERRMKLLLVGDGMRMNQVREILEAGGVMAQCVLTGLIPQLEGPSYLAACDILVSPQIPNADGSPFFGSPTKLFEYMAMGKAIAASELEQIGEVIHHQKTGLLCRPGNVEDLKAALLRLAEDPALRKRLGQAARADVLANYTWEAHVARTMKKLEELCG